MQPLPEKRELHRIVSSIWCNSDCECEFHLQSVTSCVTSDAAPSQSKFSPPGCSHYPINKESLHRTFRVFGATRTASANSICKVSEVVPPVTAPSQRKFNPPEDAATARKSKVSSRPVFNKATSLFSSIVATANPKLPVYTVGRNHARSICLGNPNEDTRKKYLYQTKKVRSVHKSWKFSSRIANYSVAKHESSKSQKNCTDPEKEEGDQKKQVSKHKPKLPIYKKDEEREDVKALTGSWSCTKSVKFNFTCPKKTKEEKPIKNEEARPSKLFLQCKEASSKKLKAKEECKDEEKDTCEKSEACDEKKEEDVCEKKVEEEVKCEEVECKEEKSEKVCEKDDDGKPDRTPLTLCIESCKAAQEEEEEKEKVIESAKDGKRVKNKKGKSEESSKEKNVGGKPCKPCSSGKKKKLEGGKKKQAAAVNCDTIREALSKSAHSSLAVTTVDNVKSLGDKEGRDMIAKLKKELEECRKARMKKECVQSPKLDGKLPEIPPPDKNVIAGCKSAIKNVCDGIFNKKKDDDGDKKKASKKPAKSKSAPTVKKAKREDIVRIIKSADCTYDLDPPYCQSSGKKGERKCEEQDAKKKAKAAVKKKKKIPKRLQCLPEEDYYKECEAKEEKEESCDGQKEDQGKATKDLKTKEWVDYKIQKKTCKEEKAKTEDSCGREVEEKTSRRKEGKISRDSRTRASKKEGSDDHKGKEDICVEGKARKSLKTKDSKEKNRPCAQGKKKSDGKSPSKASLETKPDTKKCPRKEVCPKQPDCGDGKKKKDDDFHDKIQKICKEEGIPQKKLQPVPDQSPIMQCIALTRKKMQADAPQPGKGVPPRDKRPCSENMDACKKIAKFEEKPKEAKKIREPLVPCKYEETKPEEIGDCGVKAKKDCREIEKEECDEERGKKAAQSATEDLKVCVEKMKAGILAKFNEDSKKKDEHKLKKNRSVVETQKKKEEHSGKEDDTLKKSKSVMETQKKKEERLVKEQKRASITDRKTTSVKSMTDLSRFIAPCEKEESGPPDQSPLNKCIAFCAEQKKKKIGEDKNSVCEETVKKEDDCKRKKNVESIKVARSSYKEKVKKPDRKPILPCNKAKTKYATSVKYGESKKKNQQVVSCKYEEIKDEVYRRIAGCHLKNEEEDNRKCDEMKNDEKEEADCIKFKVEKTEECKNQAGGSKKKNEECQDSVKNTDMELCKDPCPDFKKNGEIEDCKREGTDSNKLREAQREESDACRIESKTVVGCKYEEIKDEGCQKISSCHLMNKEDEEKKCEEMKKDESNSMGCAKSKESKHEASEIEEREESKNMVKKDEEREGEKCGSTDQNEECLQVVTSKNEDIEYATPLWAKSCPKFRNPCPDFQKIDEDKHCMGKSSSKNETEGTDCNKLQEDRNDECKHNDADVSKGKNEEIDSCKYEDIEEEVHRKIAGGYTEEDPCTKKDGENKCDEMKKEEKERFDCNKLKQEENKNTECSEHLEKEERADGSKVLEDCEDKSGDTRNNEDMKAASPCKYEDIPDEECRKIAACDKNSCKNEECSEKKKEDSCKEEKKNIDCENRRGGNELKKEERKQLTSCKYEDVKTTIPFLRDDTNAESIKQNEKEAKSEECLSAAEEAICNEEQKKKEESKNILVKCKSQDLLSPKLDGKLPKALETPRDLIGGTIYFVKMICGCLISPKEKKPKETKEDASKKKCEAILEKTKSCGALKKEEMGLKKFTTRANEDKDESVKITKCSEMQLKKSTTSNNGDKDESPPYCDKSEQKKESSKHEDKKKKGSCGPKQAQKPFSRSNGTCTNEPPKCEESEDSQKKPPVDCKKKEAPASPCDSKKEKKGEISLTIEEKKLKPLVVCRKPGEARMKKCKPADNKPKEEKGRMKQLMTCSPSRPCKQHQKMKCEKEEKINNVKSKSMPELEKTKSSNCRFCVNKSKNTDEGATGRKKDPQILEEPLCPSNIKEEPDQSPIMQCVRMCRAGKRIPPKEKEDLPKTAEVKKDENENDRCEEKEEIKVFVPCKYETIPSGVRGKKDQEKNDEDEKCEEKEEKIKVFEPCNHEVSLPGARERKDQECEENLKECIREDQECEEQKCREYLKEFLPKEDHHECEENKEEICKDEEEKSDRSKLANKEEICKDECPKMAPYVVGTSSCSQKLKNPCPDFQKKEERCENSDNKKSKIPVKCKKEDPCKMKIDLVSKTAESACRDRYREETKKRQEVCANAKEDVCKKEERCFERFVANTDPDLAKSDSCEAKKNEEQIKIKSGVCSKDDKESDKEKTKCDLLGEKQVQNADKCPKVHFSCPKQEEEKKDCGQKEERFGARADPCKENNCDNQDNQVKKGDKFERFGINEDPCACGEKKNADKTLGCKDKCEAQIKKELFKARKDTGGPRFERFAVTENPCTKAKQIKNETDKGTGSDKCETSSFWHKVRKPEKSDESKDEGKICDKPKDENKK